MAEARALPVEVIDARQAHAVMRLQHNKTEAKDAELLAEIARSGFCRPVAVKSAAAQKQRILLKARSHLVRRRRDTENTLRDLLGSLGIRFPKSRAVGAYLGLTSRRFQSGEVDYSGRISKHGEGLLRSRLIRGGEQPVDGGAQGSSAERLGAANQKAEQPQTSLRRPGAQAGRRPAPHADQWRSVPLAGKGGRRNRITEQEHEERFRDKRTTRPRRDGGRGDPVVSLARRA